MKDHKGDSYGFRCVRGSATRLNLGLEEANKLPDDPPPSWRIPYDPPRRGDWVDPFSQ